MPEKIQLSREYLVTEQTESLELNRKELNRKEPRCIRSII